MLKRQEWVKIIRRNDKAKIHKMTKRLFQNMEETLEFIRGYFEFAAELAKKGENPRTALMERARKINIATRNAFLDIPLESAATVIQRLDSSLGSPAAATLIGSTMADEGNIAIQFLTRLIALIFIGNNDIRQTGVFISAVRVLYFTVLGSGPSHADMRTWENALRHMRAQADARLIYYLEEIARFRGSALSVIPYSKWRPVSDIKTGIKTLFGKTFTLPVPDDLEPWLSGIVKNIYQQYREREERLNKILNRFEDDYERYRAHYSDMWLEMMLNPHYALRPDGHDWVDIAIPEIRDLGLRKFNFFPGRDFPSFRAQIARERFGHLMIDECDAAPADLPVLDETMRRAIDRRFIFSNFLSYLAVRCVWRIVMGKEPEASGAGQSNGGGGGPAIVRPFFRKLPEGFRMSAEARKRALATFQTEPQPGFTFVRGYRRGDEPHSGEPLWSLSEDDLTLPS